MNKTQQQIRDNLRDNIYSIIRGAENNDLEEIKKALEEDPECINAQDERMGIMALHIAAADGNISLVQFLLEQPGCLPARADSAGRDACYLAEAIGRDDIVELINEAVYQRMLTRFGPEIDARAVGDVDENAEEETTSSDAVKVLEFPGRPPRPSGP